MLSVPHLDRDFDYLVSAEQSDDAQPGVRVRVRFHGRLVDGFVLERRNDTDHAGKLGWLDRVISAEPVLTPEIRRLVDAVAARYAGTRPDVLRLAVPVRHARVEKEPAAVADLAGGSSAGGPIGLGRLRPRGTVLSALSESRAARAVWQALPGEPWADRFAEAAAQTIRAGKRCWRSCPDQRDWTRCARPRRPASTNTAWWRSRPAWGRRPATGAGCGAAGQRAVGDRHPQRGVRAAERPGLVMVWADADDSLAEPRAPYPHAREVAMLRAHQAGARR